MSEKITINTYTVIKETEKAILINAKLPELEKETDFWLPKSKITVAENEITMEQDFSLIKLEEVTNPEPKNDILVEVSSKVSDKGEKATKIIIDVKFNKTTDTELWLYIPNSQIKEVKKLDNGFILVIPEWVYNSSLKSSIDRKLEFYNKEEVKYGHEDFEIISNV